MCSKKGIYLDCGWVMLILCIKRFILKSMIFNLFFLNLLCKRKKMRDFYKVVIMNVVG